MQQPSRVANQLGIRSGHVVCDKRLHSLVEVVHVNRGNAASEAVRPRLQVASNIRGKLERTRSREIAVDRRLAPGTVGGARGTP